MHTIYLERVKFWIQLWEPTQGPDGEHVSIAGVCNSTGFVEYSLYPFLHVPRTEKNNIMGNILENKDHARNTFATH